MISPDTWWISLLHLSLPGSGHQTRREPAELTASTARLPTGTSSHQGGSCSIKDATIELTAASETKIQTLLILETAAFPSGGDTLHHLCRAYFEDLN